MGHTSYIIYQHIENKLNAILDSKLPQDNPGVGEKTAKVSVLNLKEKGSLNYLPYDLKYILIFCL